MHRPKMCILRRRLSRQAWRLLSTRLAVDLLAGFVTGYGFGGLRPGDEFLLSDLIADVSAEQRRGRRPVVLTLTPASQRQLSCRARWVVLRMGRLLSSARKAAGRF
jgi:hypothetical protein